MGTQSHIQQGCGQYVFEYGQKTQGGKVSSFDTEKILQDDLYSFYLMQRRKCVGKGAG